MTAFYIARLMFMTFHGKPRAGEEAMHHAHESPWVMLIPLIVLAIGATILGAWLYNDFVGAGRDAFWKAASLCCPVTTRSPLRKGYRVWSAGCRWCWALPA